MPGSDDELSSVVRDAVREGTFPDSDILTSNLTIQEIPALLRTIANARDELNLEIKSASKDEASNVDEWIAQAKKVQYDIKQCKIEAQQIVQEHERVEASRTAAEDARNKVQLLENEIRFTQALQQQIQTISVVSRSLKQAEQDISEGNSVGAVTKLSEAQSSITGIPASETRSLLQDFHHELRQNSHQRLLAALDSKFVVSKDGGSVQFQVLTDKIPNSSLSQQDATVDNLSTDEILKALNELGCATDAITLIVKKLESSLLQYVPTTARQHILSARADGMILTVSLGSGLPSTQDFVVTLGEILRYLRAALPSSTQDAVASQVLPKTLSKVVSDWLNAAIPLELDSLHRLVQLQNLVDQISSEIAGFSWPGADELQSWSSQVPKIWLTKRRMFSLDGIRRAFNTAQGATRSVERVEKQTVISDPVILRDAATETENDWNENWGEEDEQQNSKSSEGPSATEDEEDAWGFGDDDEQKLDNTNTKSVDETDETDEAWGWGDESPTREKKTAGIDLKQNGIRQKQSQPKEEIMTLTELYSITDIPDFILEIIGRDLHDAQEMESTPLSYFPTTSNTPRLSSLPTLILAMFRATAPTYYSLSSSIGSMNLYNDTLYISQKLRENSTSSTMVSLENDCLALDKFARSAYSKEMEIQRTILNDLLDGAQGFTSCTKFPYAAECENAVSGTVDRIRTVHKDWVSILSPSHLQQAIGALLASVIGKIIKDIEDMEDISEPESQRLHNFCDQVSSLSDLFSTAPSSTGDRNENDGSPTTSVAVYVSNWLRFQYLMQILDSSLVDIKYLWTDAGLSLEFSPDEVVDLIRALFAESTHRRNAIVAIRA